LLRLPLLGSGNFGQPHKVTYTTAIACGPENIGTKIKVCTSYFRLMKNVDSVSVLGNRDVYPGSRFLIFYPSQIPDRNNSTQRGKGKKICPTIFCSYKYHEIVNYFIFEQVKKNFFAKTLRIGVSPTYGYIESALVKCSNDEGLGPKYNREKDPGSSIFSMLMVYGCYLHLLTFSGKQVTGRINGDPFPPLQTKLG
jgi:hypothetical protein